MSEKKSWRDDINISTVVTWLIMAFGFAFTIGYSKSEFDTVKSNQLEQKVIIKEIDKNHNTLKLDLSKETIINENQQILINKHEIKLYP